MHFITGLENFLRLINDNWTTILVIIGLVVGLYQKIRIFISKSDEEKIKIAKTQISDMLMHLVTAAEEDYEFWNKAGSIKRSQVLAEIYSRYPILSKVTNQEDLANWLDHEIDIALNSLTNIIKINDESETEKTEEIAETEP